MIHLFDMLCIPIGNFDLSNYNRFAANVIHPLQVVSIKSRPFEVNKPLQMNYRSELKEFALRRNCFIDLLTIPIFNCISRVKVPMTRKFLLYNVKEFVKP